MEGQDQRGLRTNVETKLYIFYLFAFVKLVVVMAPHSSSLAWKIPWTEECGRLQSMRMLRVKHD